MMKSKNLDDFGKKWILGKKKRIFGPKICILLLNFLMWGDFYIFGINASSGEFIFDFAPFKRAVICDIIQIDDSLEVEFKFMLSFGGEQLRSGTRFCRARSAAREGKRNPPVCRQYEAEAIKIVLCAVAGNTVCKIKSSDKFTRQGRNFTHRV